MQEDARRLLCESVPEQEDARTLECESVLEQADDALLLLAALK
jgi:hypothetical protein